MRLASVFLVSPFLTSCNVGALQQMLLSKALWSRTSRPPTSMNTRFRSTPDFERRTRSLFRSQTYLSNSCSMILSSDAASSNEHDDQESAHDDREEVSTQEKSLSFGERVKLYFNPPSDGLNFRQRLAKMGLACMLSYGWVSNMSYTVTVSLAWYIFSKQTGKSPLAPGQWKGFLAVYAGFFVFNNIVRPVRLAVSVVVAPKFEQIVESLQRRLNISKAAAVAVVVFLANVVMTTTLMCLGILGAATLAEVPVWAK